MTSTTDLLSSSTATNGTTSNVASTYGKTTGGTTDTSAAASQKTLDGDVNFFLTMLTTQLKEQDPTAPMDVAQMTQQIAQYSGVEQQVKTNTNLETLIASNKQSNLSDAVGYIGKEVETKGTTGEVVGGQGAFSYVLPSAASNVDITISDANGTAVFTGKGSTDNGRNVVVWNGQNSFTGAQEPDGTYTIGVKATDASANALTPDIRAVGIVAGVQTDSSGTLQLNIGNGTVNYSDVLAVREPTRLTSTTGTDTGTSGTASNSGTGSAT